jgi:uncharacterized membrane protein (DUF2068 family)
VSRAPSETGLKAVAAFEALKGLVVLAAGFGLVALVHHDAQALAEHLVSHAHLNPASRYPRIFLELAGRLDDARLWGLAALAAAYSTLRLCEAYGLWHDRAWAEWLGVLSGGVYVPLECIHILERPSVTHAIVLSGNLGVVLFLWRVLWLRRRASRPPRRAG